MEEPHGLIHISEELYFALLLLAGFVTFFVIPKIIKKIREKKSVMPLKQGKPKE
jgi:hypothetical protein